MKNMIKIALAFIAFGVLFSGCVNKHGVSAKYYSECTEYYDYQGYYHKKCGQDDMLTYKRAGELVKKTGELFEEKKPEPIKNVW